MGQLPEKSVRHASDENAVRNERLDLLDRALQRLPAKQKRAFVLAEFEGLAYQEIAQIEATRIGTVKSRINRARRKLADVLRRYGVDQP